jgi:hypothetical protein
MGLKGYRLWVMGQLDSNAQSPTRTCTRGVVHGDLRTGRRAVALQGLRT